MLVHLNGQLLPADQARVSVFDRGFIFGDGVYEGLRSVQIDGRRRVIGLGRHVRRLQEGLNEIGVGFDAAAIGGATDALLSANNLDDAFVYWQITRGTPPARGRARPFACARAGICHEPHRVRILHAAARVGGE